MFYKDKAKAYTKNDFIKENSILAKFQEINSLKPLTKVLPINIDNMTGDCSEWSQDTGRILSAQYSAVSNSKSRDLKSTQLNTDLIYPKGSVTQNKKDARLKKSK